MLPQKERRRLIRELKKLAWLTLKAKFLGEKRRLRPSRIGVSSLCESGVYVAVLIPSLDHNPTTKQLNAFWFEEADEIIPGYKKTP